MSTDRLSEHRTTWQSKSVLRTIYEDYYRQVAAACRQGRTLEIGGGSGNFKSYAPDVVSMDVLAASWLDLVADAQVLPFADASFDNIIMLDVLHHIENPRLFLKEGVRVLRAGGKLLFLEPAITPVSWFFWKFFHPEPVNMSQDPLAYVTPHKNRQPFDANQAIPTLLFGRYRARFEKEFPQLRVCEIKRFSLLAYPLSGGFRSWSLLPAKLCAPLLQFEERLLPIFGKLAAFRLFTVLERVA